MKQDATTLALEKIDAIADRDKYLLRRKKEVIQKLKLLRKERTTISAHFESGKYSLLTLVLDVLPEKNLLILDYGPNEAINKKLLAAERITFAASYYGIQSQFVVQKITKARFDGLPVYAVPIPDALLWLQRRQSYRMKMPLENPARCRVLLDGEESFEVKLLDISATGIAFIDEKCYFSEDTEEGNQIENCRLALPGCGELKVSAEIRNRRLLKKGDVSRGQRVGCQFTNLSYAGESRIQQYILSEERKHTHVSKT